MANRPVQLARRPKHRVVLGVSGGIAAYKAPEIVRRLRERDAEVQVVLTRAAREFVTATSLQAVSGRAVRESLWDRAAEAAMGHIELARWADTIAIAPASANVIAQLAHGLAPDLLTTLCLATDARVLLAPAMNQAMWRHPATQANVATVLRRGIELLGPDEGEQACGDVGPGRMLEPQAIAAAVLDRGSTHAQLPGIRVVLTAGPTREPVDPVRYISNRSSGRMGYALAQAFQRAGADVVLISGPVVLEAPAGVERVLVNTAQEMYDAVHRYLAGTDIFVGCAAVADYRPATLSPQKLKRSKAATVLELEACPDILASVAGVDEAPFTVGFAAETNKLREHALDKLERKGIDMIAANIVGDDLAFDQAINALNVYWRGGETELPSAAKPVLAEALVKLIADRFGQTRTSGRSSRAN
ncbi:MAG: bifunctional phosphopantothenoylcysteine decarboxylase/phosphopantothenate--cysteine ligase CoaBC [Gammaproteobacteria bacterium]|jgi:phosphopantothenoylcysteine decarboxylase/phosphopantothenate--cysteine ligase